MQITRLVQLVHRRLSVVTVTVLATVAVRWPQAAEWLSAQDPEVVSAVAGGVAWAGSRIVERLARWLDFNKDGKVTGREAIRRAEELRDHYLDRED